MKTLLHCLLALLFFEGVGIQNAEALPRPRLRGEVLAERFVEVQWTLPRRKLQKKRVLLLERAEEGHPFEPLTTVSRPSRKDVFYDLVADDKIVYSYRARLKVQRRVSSWSNPVKVALEDEPTVPLIEESPSEQAPVSPQTSWALSSQFHYCSPSTVEEVEQRINNVRQTLGLSLLAKSEQLNEAACRHSESMATQQVMTHDGWVDEVLASGYPFMGLGQNVAVGYNGPEELVQAWLESPHHKENIVNESFDEEGLCCVIDEKGVPWWTHNFGA